MTPVAPTLIACGMFTLIGRDGKEYGPVTSEQVRAWMAAGRANLETQAKWSGDDQWRRLGDFPEFGANATVPPVTPPASPVNATGRMAIDPKTYAADLIARARPLEIGYCVSRSWALLKARFWPLVGTTFLLVVVINIINAVPVFGFVASMLLGGVFYGGLYAYYLKQIRGQPAALEDAFSGFSLAFVPLLCASLVSSLLIVAGMLLLILPGIYLVVAYTFAFFLVIDQRLEFWAALEVSRRVITAQWWSVFGLLIVGGFIALLGVIGLGIGVFITLPIYIGALAYAYEDLCRPPRSEPAEPRERGEPGNHLR